MEILQFVNGNYQGYTNNLQQLEGLGCYFWRDAQIYYGNWRNNQMDGKGIMIFPQGGYVYGYFKQNLAQGMIKIVYPNQDFLYGYCTKGLFQGRFLRSFKDSNQYLDCEYERGNLIKIHDQIYSYNSFIDRVEQQFKDLIDIKYFFNSDIQKTEDKIGDSTQLKNNLIYDEFNDQMQCKQISKDEIYFGAIKQQIPNGLGVQIHLKENIISRGRFSDGFLNGRGRKNFKNGDIFDGGFNNGQISNSGIFYNNKDFNWFSGYFENNNIRTLFTMSKSTFPPALSDYELFNKKQADVKKEIASQCIYFTEKEALFLIKSLHQLSTYFPYNDEYLKIEQNNTKELPSNSEQNLTSQNQPIFQFTIPQQQPISFQNNAKQQEQILQQQPISILQEKSINYEINQEIKPLETHYKLSTILKSYEQMNRENIDMQNYMCEEQSELKNQNQEKQHNVSSLLTKKQSYEDLEQSFDQYSEFINAKYIEYIQNLSKDSTFIQQQQQNQNQSDETQTDTIINNEQVIQNKQSEQCYSTQLNEVKVNYLDDYSNNNNKTNNNNVDNKSQLYNINNYSTQNETIKEIQFMESYDNQIKSDLENQQKLNTENLNKTYFENQKLHLYEDSNKFEVEQQQKSIFEKNQTQSNGYENKENSLREKDQNKFNLIEIKNHYQPLNNNDQSKQFDDQLIIIENQSQLHQNQQQYYDNNQKNNLSENEYNQLQKQSQSNDNLNFNKVENNRETIKINSCQYSIEQNKLNSAQYNKFSQDTSSTQIMQNITPSTCENIMIEQTLNKDIVSSSNKNDSVFTQKCQIQFSILDKVKYNKGYLFNVSDQKNRRDLSDSSLNNFNNQQNTQINNISHCENTYYKNERLSLKSNISEIPKDNTDFYNLTVSVDSLQHQENQIKNKEEINDVDSSISSINFDPNTSRKYQYQQDDLPVFCNKSKLTKELQQEFSAKLKNYLQQPKIETACGITTNSDNQVTIITNEQSYTQQQLKQINHQNQQINSKKQFQVLENNEINYTINSKEEQFNNLSFQFQDKRQSNEDDFSLSNSMSNNFSYIIQTQREQLENKENCPPNPEQLNEQSQQKSLQSQKSFIKRQTKIVKLDLFGFDQSQNKQNGKNDDQENQKPKQYDNAIQIQQNKQIQSSKQINQQDQKTTNQQHQNYKPNKQQQNCISAVQQYNMYNESQYEIDYLNSMQAQDQLYDFKYNDQFQYQQQLEQQEYQKYIYQLQEQQYNELFNQQQLSSIQQDIQNSYYINNEMKQQYQNQSQNKRQYMPNRRQSCDNMNYNINTDNKKQKKQNMHRSHSSIIQRKLSQNQIESSNILQKKSIGSKSQIIFRQSSTLELQQKKQNIESSTKILKEISSKQFIPAQTLFQKLIMYKQNHKNSKIFEHSSNVKQNKNDNYKNIYQYNY